MRNAESTQDKKKAKKTRANGNFKRKKEYAKKWDFEQFLDRKKISYIFDFIRLC